MYRSLGLFLASCAVVSVEGFIATKAFHRLPETSTLAPKTWEIVPRSRLSMVVDTEPDCGCQVSVRFDGVPTEAARTVNHRDAIRRHPVYSAKGTSCQMDDLIGRPDDGQIAVVVFLRSLG